MIRYTLRKGISSDQQPICDFLEQHQMVTEGVLAPQSHYWIAEAADSSMIGVVGIELGTRVALLRSAAVRESLRKQGIGEALVKAALAACREFGCRDVYCFSTHAETYWQQMGFAAVGVPELVAALPDAPQVIHFDKIG